MPGESPLPPWLQSIEFDVITYDCLENEEKAFIDYLSDPRFYDSGHKITMFY
jgi:hypothetical protein